jgi:hypothetical protein
MLENGRANNQEGGPMAEAKTATQTKDVKIYTIVVAIWMVLLISYGVLTLLGFFR